MGDKGEWLCEPCKTIHPVQVPGRVVQPCPQCGACMVPTSKNLRKLAALRAELKGAQLRIAELEAKVQQVELQRNEIVKGYQDRLGENFESLAEQRRKVEKLEAYVGVQDRNAVEMAALAEDRLSRAEAAEQRIKELEAQRDQWRSDWRVTNDGLVRALDRAEAADARLAATRRVIEEWQKQADLKLELARLNRYDHLELVHACINQHNTLRQCASELATILGEQP